MTRARPEHQIQAAIMQFWQLRGRKDLAMFAVPNGELRNPIVARRLKAEGVMPGVADLCVILHAGRTGWLEVKAPKGRLSPEQKAFGEFVQKRGHEWALVRDLKDAQIVLAMWNALRGNRDVAE